MKRLAIAGAVGAALTWFLDPTNGASRRNTTRDRALAFVRSRRRNAEQAGGVIGSRAYATAQKARHLREERKELDDATLARKVESIIFRDADAPKGDVLVNVQEGIVQLRGEVATPEMIERLVRGARKVQGVRNVENLLPMHQ
jgi:osmotically-inducible protein OsmY